MKISKDKRDKLIMVAMGTVAVLAGLWYLLIISQTDRLHEIGRKIEAAKDKETRMQTAVKLAGAVEVELAAAAEKMSTIETEMASGDLYSWMYNAIKDFKSAYRVEIPQFSSVEPGECNLLYKFPFKQVKMTVTGSGYFHDLGKFVADFENHFPHMRLQILEAYPGMGAQSSADREKLAFRMEVIALVKPTAGK